MKIRIVRLVSCGIIQRTKQRGNSNKLKGRIEQDENYPLTYETCIDLYEIIDTNETKTIVNCTKSDSKFFVKGRD